MAVSESLFIHKIVGAKAFNVFQKSYFPVNVVKFFKNTYLIEHLPINCWLCLSLFSQNFLDQNLNFKRTQIPVKIHLIEESDSIELLDYLHNFYFQGFCILKCLGDLFYEISGLLFT